MTFPSSNGPDLRLQLLFESRHTTTTTTAAAAGGVVGAERREACVGGHEQLAPGLVKLTPPLVLDPVP